MPKIHDITLKQPNLCPPMEARDWMQLKVCPGVKLLGKLQRKFNLPQREIGDKVIFAKQHTGSKWNTISEANAVLKSFEASIGALTRTMKSIDRATLLAIDCAKFDIAVKERAREEIFKKIFDIGSSENVDPEIQPEFKRDVMTELMVPNKPGRAHGYGTRVTKSQVTKFSFNLRRMGGEVLTNHNRELLDKVEYQSTTP